MQSGDMARMPPIMADKGQYVAKTFRSMTRDYMSVNKLAAVMYSYAVLELAFGQR